MIGIIIAFLSAYGVACSIIYAYNSWKQEKDLLEG